MGKISGFGKASIKLLLFFLYLTIIFYLTLLNREPGTERMAWTALFGSYRRAWEESHEFILWGLIDNVVMMIPLGLLFPWINGKIRLRHTMAFAFILTVFIESTQYMSRLGYFDVDDIWNNLWGTGIGYGIYGCLGELAGAQKDGRKIRYAVLAGNILPLAAFLVFFTFFARIALAA